MSNLAKYEQRGDDWFCKQCGSKILAVIRYYPVWDGPFPCSGSGEVVTENIPFCPVCEEKPSSIGTPSVKQVMPSGGCNEASAAQDEADQHLTV